MRMTPEEEAEYAIAFNVSRADLPREAQGVYDRLLEQRMRGQPPRPVSQAVDLEYNMPLLLRIFVVLFSAGTALFTVVTFVTGFIRGQGASGALIGIPAFAVFPAILGYRLFRLSLHADVQGLTIRNLAWTYRVPAGQITGFDLGSSQISGYPSTVRVLTRDAQIPIQVFVLEAVDSREQEMTDWLAAVRARSADGHSESGGGGPH
jgi:hypothetical protein